LYLLFELYEELKMKNPLIEKLETDAQQRSSVGKIVGLKALFLAQKDQIEEALKSGWKRTEVWSILKENGSYPGTYSAFLKHCSKFISPSSKDSFNTKRKTPKKETPAPETSQTAKPEQASQEPQKERRKPLDTGDCNFPTFTRNLNKEDISFL